MERNRVNLDLLNGIRCCICSATCASHPHERKPQLRLLLERQDRELRGRLCADWHKSFSPAKTRLQWRSDTGMTALQGSVAKRISTLGRNANIAESSQIAFRIPGANGAERERRVRRRKCRNWIANSLCNFHGESVLFHVFNCSGKPIPVNSVQNSCISAIVIQDCFLGD